MNKYYEVIGYIGGDKDVIYGSFVKADCQYELEAERDQLKAEGYKKLSIVGRETEDAPNTAIYEDQIVTIDTLWMKQAPSFNFELDKDELLAEALERGFVTPCGDGIHFVINEDY